MEKSFHQFSDLFAQLGLPSDSESIERFIVKHTPLDDGVLLENAHFWTESQSALIREQVLLDADWAAMIDQLNENLRVK